MYQLIKSLLFLMPAERAHHFTMKSFNLLLAAPILSPLIKAMFRFEHDSLMREVYGLTFKNPVGLAAGFDKDGKYIETLAALGFGFIEVGTTTPRPQIGNPKPRLFRLKEDRGIINRMGFNNEGVDVLVSRLAKLKNRKIIIGGNIGKNKDTPNETAYKDYLICLEKLYPYVDYFVVNLSSPNTPGLRELQEKEPLKKLLIEVLAYRDQQSVRRPILLKIAPDLTAEQVKDVAEITEELALDGLIATNTTISRVGLKTASSAVESIGAGGLSGDPVFQKSTDILSLLYERTKGAIPIIGVGGISSTAAAETKMKAGAALIQIYSGFIYEGPFLIKRIKKNLVESYSMQIKKAT
jgi:dihydroorotate dehydrogenase